MKKLTFILVTTILFNMPLHAEKMRIAVMNFKAKGVTRALAENVSELIRGEMINTGRYIVIERAQMDNILKEQGFQKSGCTDVSCAVEVGKILSAKKILIGTVMKLGGMIIISARIVDVQSGTGEFSEKQNARSETDLYNAVTLFTQKLTNRISGGVPVYEKPPTYKEDEFEFKYDPWYMGMEYMFGQVKYETGETGVDFLIAMSFSNSYGSLVHYGVRIGALGIIGPVTYGAEDKYEIGKTYADDASGVFAELSAGLNLRIPSDWFGIKIYGGIGIFNGSMDVVTYSEDEYYFDSFSSDNSIKYKTPFFTLHLELPMSSRGTKFACPMIQLVFLPTPDEIDQSYLTIINFVAFKHVW